MKKIIQKNKRWFAYALYGVLLTAGLLYLRFPSDAVRDYVQAKADRSNLPLLVAIGDISPSFTLGLEFQETALSRHADPEKILFRADRLCVRPALWSFLRGQLRLCFDGVAYAGALKGCVQFMKKGLKAPFGLSITLKDIDIGANDTLPSLIGRHVAGRLGGTMTYSGKNQSLIEGSGEADLRLSGGRVELLKPILTLEAIDFDEVLAKMTLKDRKIDLTHVELKGPSTHGTLWGTIRLRRDFLNSSLDLRGNIDPFADSLESPTDTRDSAQLSKQSPQSGGLEFVIRGTLMKPIFRPLL